MMSMRALGLAIVTLCLTSGGCSDPDEVPGESNGDSMDDGDPSTTTGQIPPPTTTTSTTTSNPTTVTTTTATTATATDTAPTTLDGTDTEIEPETDTSTLPDCDGVGIGMLGIGDGCAANEDCASGVCALFGDAPVDIDAVCEAPADDCSTRFTGSILDIVTQQPVVGADFSVASALQAATNPRGATSLASAQSDAQGHFDALSSGPVNAPIGLIGLASTPGFTFTGTGVAAVLANGTTYNVANDVHDVWLVSNNAAAAWSAMLGLDPMIDPADLPLGTEGGAVVLTRDAAGMPLADVVVTSTDNDSSALVRYLNPDGTFNTTTSTALGLVVILGPALAETFEATFNGVPIGQAEVLSASSLIYTVAFTAP